MLALSELEGASVSVRANDQPPDPGEAPIEMSFSDGTKLRATYWRLIVNDKAGVSSFDQGHRYGMPAPVDAIDELGKTLHDKLVTDAFLDSKTGDIVVRFSEEVVLQVLNFTAFEVWQITFPNGTGEYSNYAK